MKKGTKVVLAVAGFAAALGIIGVVLGLVMGADFRDLQAVGIYLTPHQSLQLSHNRTQGQNKEVYRYSMEVQSSETKSSAEQRKEATNIDSLEVELNYAQITIATVKDTDTISYRSNTEKVISKTEGSTLKVSGREIGNSPVELEIYIPEKMLKEVELELAAGNIVADQIMAEEVSLEIDAASVQIEKLQVSRKAELQIHAGEMIVEYYDGPYLEAECGMGSIFIVCEGNKEAYNYELECGLGEIRINEEVYSAVGSERKINNQAGKFMEIECGMGEIVLEFPNSL